MIRSMTGYGKAVATLENGSLTIEIKTLNGKNADISLKSNILPKDKEIHIRQLIAEKLQRGSIDVFLSYEANSAENVKSINAAVASEYYKQLSAIAQGVGAEDALSSSEGKAAMISTIMHMPDIFDNKKADIITDENWGEVEKGFIECLEKVDEYRATEGRVLYDDVCSRVRTILALEDEVESHEQERIDNVKARITKAAEDMKLELKEERFEQEMIFYLEKLDINEEKVRLRQHCQYFLDTIDSEQYPGKKLGFIIQEMGREINTTGSKANHALIQKSVVNMKNELEKIREQSLNIL